MGRAMTIQNVPDLAIDQFAIISRGLHMKQPQMFEEMVRYYLANNKEAVEKLAKLEYVVKPE